MEGEPPGGFSFLYLLSPASAQQLVPATAQRGADALQRGERDVDFAGLDLLDASWIQAELFRERFLSQAPPQPLAPDGGPEAGQASGLLAGQRHALLRRNRRLTNTPG